MLEMKVKEERMYTHWFVFHAGLSYAKKQILLDLSISPKQLYHMNPLERKAYISDREEEIYTKSLELDTTKWEIDWLERNGGWTVFLDEDQYPESLKHIYRPPLGLYVLGKLPATEQLTIAMIGARDASPYGQQAAKEFSKQLAHAGVGIISGLARGIDAYSHRGALEVGGYTLGILGCGIDICYPKSHAYLYEQIRMSGGLISEFPLKTQAFAGNFPRRNRIISGISKGIFVIEAKEKSGSLITVQYGLEQGKDIFALPGRYYDEMSKGCHELILNGGKLVFHPDQILEEYNCFSNKKLRLEFSENLVLANHEKLVYDCLRLEGTHIDRIVEETKLPVSEVSAILMILELKQYIEQVNKNYYRRKR